MAKKRWVVVSLWLASMLTAMGITAYIMFEYQESRPIGDLDLKPGKRVVEVIETSTITYKLSMGGDIVETINRHHVVGGAAEGMS